MQIIRDTELILNADNKVYHLNVSGEDIADNIIVVGDQNRVKQVSNYFDKIDFRAEHREFITHTGFYNNQRLTVLSTGIGTDNIDIVVNELDAAANIDLQKREQRKEHRKLNIIRLGTCGSLQEDIHVNQLVVSTHGIGLDGLLCFYKNWENVSEVEMSEAFIKHCTWPRTLPFPYCVAAGESLLNKFNHNQFVKGITATAPGFYGPQGRQIKLPTTLPQLNENLSTFTFEQNRIINFEMETSALYGLSKLLNHCSLTVCVVIGNRVTKQFTSNYNQSVSSLIETCLNTITNNS
jgi:uridine phosphorylase